MTGSETRQAAPAHDGAAQIGADTNAHIPEPGMFAELSTAFTSARAVLTNFLDLLTLEARAAGLALTWMIICGVLASVFIITAWLGCMLALAMGAISLGVPVLGAVIAVAVLNGVAGIVLIYASINMSTALRFPATRRQVSGQCPVKRSSL